MSDFEAAVSEQAVKVRFHAGPKEAVGGVLFVRVGKRRCLTLWQLQERPWLGAVLRRHMDRFTFDGEHGVWWFHDG